MNPVEQTGQKKGSYFRDLVSKYTALLSAWSKIFIHLSIQISLWGRNLEDEEEDANDEALESDETYDEALETEDTLRKSS